MVFNSRAFSRAFAFELTGLFFHLVKNSKKSLCRTKQKTRFAPDKEFLKLCTKTILENLESKIKACCDQAVGAIETNYKNELASPRVHLFSMQQN